MKAGISSSISLRRRMRKNSLVCARQLRPWREKVGVLPSVRTSLSGGASSRASGSPRHWMAMRTRYVFVEMEPVSLPSLFRASWMADAIMEPSLFSASQMLTLQQFVSTSTISGRG